MKKFSISRELIQKEFEKLLQIIFSLQETEEVRVRDITLNRQQDGQQRGATVRKIMDVSFHDIFSDIDLLVVVKRRIQDKKMELSYMKQIERYGMTADRLLGIAFVPESRMYRIVLKNGMRYDFGFEFMDDENAVPLEEVIQGGVPGTAKHDIYGEIPGGVQQQGSDHPNWSMENVDRFWFVQIQALGKLYRGDYLIGDHLANMNINETLVQQMILRDLQYGTNHHRYGYHEKLQYQRYCEPRDEERKAQLCFRHTVSAKAQLCGCHTLPAEAQPVKDSVEDTTFCEIVEKLYSAALAYDELTKRFYPEYQDRQEDFFAIWEAYEQEMI